MKVSRVEDKYVISYLDYVYLKNALAPFMTLDRGEKYWIRSLYFDTFNNKDYEEKLIGKEKHKKIRLRIYSLNDEKVKLEVKKKNNKFSEKESTSISREDAISLIEGKFDLLKNYKTSGSATVYAESKKNKLWPVALIDYYREAYYMPFNDIRITFDMEVKAAKAKDLFTDNNMFPMHKDGIMILEVKYNGFLPRFIKSVISSISLTQVSVSKYIMARERLG